MFSLTVFLSAQLKNMSKDPEPKQVEEKKEKPADAKKNDCCVCCSDSCCASCGVFCLSSKKGETLQTEEFFFLRVKPDAVFAA